MCLASGMTGEAVGLVMTAAMEATGDRASTAPPMMGDAAPALSILAASSAW